jgi:hypothetical protein
MAFNLKAVLRLDDKFSTPMKRAQRAAEQMQNATKRTQRATEAFNASQRRANHGLREFTTQARKVGRSMRSIASNLNPLKSGFLGLATAIGGAITAKKLFDSTIGEAAKFEQSSVMIRAMFDNKGAARQYMKMLERFAIDSPIMDSQTMFANSKSFITASKDIKQLEKMWDLAERLAAVDPVQGVEGAVFALRELFSGDAISMIERFEMPRQIMNEIKKMDLPQQLDALDKYFTKIGITTKLVNEMGGTTLGLWNRVREQINVVLREMGEPALKVVSDFLKGIIDRFNQADLDGQIYYDIDSGMKKVYQSDLSRFAEFGGRIIKNILNGLTTGITKIYDWFAMISSSEEFQQKTTLWGKVEFLIGKVYERFKQWLSSRGKNEIQNVTETFVKALATSIENNAIPLAEAALKVGVIIGNAVAKGISDAISNNPIAKAVLGGAAGAAIGSVVPGVGTLLGGAIGAGAALGKHYIDKLGDSIFGNKPKSFNGGLNYVPYNGFSARLHRGEMVLTRGEAQEYRKGRAGGGVNVTISGNTFHVRQDSDIKKVAHELARLLEREGELMA